MLDKKQMMDDIRLGLSVLQHYIRPGGPMNLNEINVHAEDFVGDLLNALYGWDLKNTNRKVSNFPCIDLHGKSALIGVQVSSERGAGKVNEALECLEKHDMSKLITQFYHFSLIPRQSTYAIHSVPTGIRFSEQEDVLDFDVLQKRIQAAELPAIAAVRAAVVQNMPLIFAAEVNRLTALRTQLHDCQTIFDRDVMRAPFDREDPLEMYRAIRGMRVRLQKHGASRIPHEAVAANFEKAKTILSTCEGAVRQRFPYIHTTAKDGTRPTYQGSDFGDAINLMMGIRPQLVPLIEENDSILRDIDNRLSHL